jgi:hypothetical protein
MRAATNIFAVWRRERENMNMRRHCCRWILIAGFCLLALPSGTFGTVIQMDPYEFAVLSGGQLSTDSGVMINGLAGSRTSVYLGDRSHVAGVYSGGRVDSGSAVTIDGRIVAGGGVYLNQGTTAAGVQSQGDIGLASGVRVNGDLNARGGISINSNSKIAGAAYYRGSYWAASPGSVALGASRGGPAPEAWQVGVRSSPGSFPVGSGQLWYPSNSTVQLLEGTYGNLSLSQNSIIQMASGTFDLSGMWLGQGTRLIADTRNGDVLVNIAGALSTSADVTFEKIGSGSVVFLSNGAVYLGSGNRLDASFVTFGSSLSVDRNTQVDGTLYSQGSLWLGQNVIVDGIGAVPEPVTAMLLLSGAGVMVIRRRRAATHSHASLSRLPRKLVRAGTY